jgi:dihydrofolate synthase/folylpolyglutamate synthase
LDWPARIEVLAEQPVIILDSAHNVPSVVALAETLARDWPKLRPRTLVFAVSADKQYEEMLGVLANNFDRILLTRFSNNPRSVEPSILAGCLSRVGFSGTTETIPEAPEALEQALALTPQTGLVSICGSVFLAGELRMLLTQRTKNLSRAVGSFTD